MRGFICLTGCFLFGVQKPPMLYIYVMYSTHCRAEGLARFPRSHLVRVHHSSTNPDKTWSYDTSYSYKRRCASGHRIGLKVRKLQPSKSQVSVQVRQPEQAQVRDKERSCGVGWHQADNSSTNIENVRVLRRKINRCRYCCWQHQRQKAIKANQRPLRLRAINSKRRKRKADGGRVPYRGVCRGVGNGGKCKEENGREHAGRYLGCGVTRWKKRPIQ